MKIPFITNFLNKLEEKNRIKIRKVLDSVKDKPLEIQIKVITKLI